ncbi:MAG TPA: carbohydrate ABC transporter permease [Chloroflexota bacterium]|nr:carbohydrate ABC transporter permease [Chloroflexota bacterium]
MIGAAPRALRRPTQASRALARRSVRARLARAGVHLALLAVAGVSLLPLAYMVSTSLKAEGLEYEVPIRWIPDPIVWRNYAQAFTSVPTLTFLRNTLAVALLTIVGELLTGSLAAYGFARLRFPGRNVLFMLMLSTLMLPYFVTMIPLFVLFRTLGWTNTLLPLIVPSFFGGRPIAIFLMRQFFLTLPTELDDAAKIDGAGFFRVWWSILLPLTRPALATVAILALVYHWNDFLAPLIYLNSTDNFTLALGIRLFRDQYRTFFNLTMAYATMMTLPILMVFFLFQKYFIRGISMTGLTGR